ncbi:hypothetical protein AAFC00_002699 [Neodothiora populina]|uniref:Fun14 family protein n=1 Tax=Neodothiora populina TaxID=2781224 RepID=A0ABR3P884_9PEZI
MASAFLLPRLSRPMTYGLGLSLATASVMHFRKSPSSRLIQCDTTSGGVSPRDWSFSQYTSDAKTPVVNSDGRLNRGAVRQITRGSIAGVICGLAVSVFSKTLALLFGLVVIGVQVAESKGIHIIPYGRLQSYFKDIDLRSAVQDNVALKLSFGATFALAGFARLE